MKFQNILFACSIAFVTLAVLDSIEAQLKQFSSFDDFFADLQQTADSWVDFVRKIQALMCPEQPVCASGDNEQFEKDDILRALPTALMVGNVPVKLDNVHRYAGVCCLPCSCSDTCWQHENCCPTKQVLANDNMMTEAKTECIAATIRSYNNKAGATTYLEHMYRMTTDCFIESANHTHLTSCRTPDTGNFDDIIPVTSKTTGTAYWNRACAACNDDDNDIIVWTPSVIFKIVMPYFGISRSMGIPPFPDTFEKLNTFVRVPRQGELIYKPPLSMEDSVCVRKDSIYMDFCKPPPDRNNHVLQEWLSDACDKFYSPIYGTVQPFMNIFCYICQAKIEPNGKESNCRRIFGRGGIGFTALLNYKRDEGKSEDDGKDDLIDENESCGCTKIYDPHLHICRPTFCPAGEIYAGCKCIKILQDLSGMPVLVTIKVLSKSDTPLTDIKIRKLQESTKRSILSLVDFITISIGATFRLKNDYLAIGVIRADPGNDTKLTIEPLIEYLDTDKRIEITVGQHTFSATLTTKIALWEEQNKTTYARTYKARDMEKTTDTFELIYADDEIMSATMTYQPLSRLLYCKQLQLDDTEYFERSGLIIANASAPRFSTCDYYRITPKQIRVCADSYIQVLKGKSLTSRGPGLQKISNGLMILSLALAMVI